MKLVVFYKGYGYTFSNNDHNVFITRHNTLKRVDISMRLGKFDEINIVQFMLQYTRIGVQFLDIEECKVHVCGRVFNLSDEIKKSLPLPYDNLAYIVSIIERFTDMFEAYKEVDVKSKIGERGLIIESSTVLGTVQYICLTEQFSYPLYYYNVYTDVDVTEHVEFFVNNGRMTPEYAEGEQERFEADMHAERYFVSIPELNIQEKY